MKSRLARFLSMRLAVRGVFILAAAMLFHFTAGSDGVAAQTVDDHGDTLSTATTLTLDSSINGRIDPGNDPDVFRLDLSGQSGNTHVWVYTTGSLDTLGGLYDSAGERISINDNTTVSSGVIVDRNLRVRETLQPGVYYIGVFSADEATTGDYILHVKADDHSHFLNAATPLALGFSVAGRITPGFDGDAFKLDLSAATGITHVWLYTTGALDTWGRLYDSDGQLITGNDDTTIGGVIVETNFRIPRTLAPGVYYIWVLSADRITTGNYTLHAKTDDHGASFSTATTLDLGSTVQGAITPGFDRDTFKLDLSGASGTTDVWIYTSGDLDTRGWLYGSDGGPYLVFNADSYIKDREKGFHIRRRLPSGVYYIRVQTWLTASGDFDTGDYTLHAQAVTDPGNSTGTAKPLPLDSPTPGSIDTARDADYFRLVLTESKNLVVYAIGLRLFHPDNGGLPIEPLDGAVLDNNGGPIGVNVYPIEFNGRKLPSPMDRHGFRMEDEFEPGTYYFKVTTPTEVVSHPVHYTIHALEDTSYIKFINNCEASTTASNNQEIDDSLFGCQWHLRNEMEGGIDISVESVWAEGITGEGVNVAVVDDGMDSRHEDLAPNVNTTLNHNYHTGISDPHDIYARYEHHGTNVAGIISARDNGIGVRGVAPRSTIYGYNYLAGNWQQFVAVNEADAMARNRVITAVSNNSWGPRSGPGLSPANLLWKMAVESGIKEGYYGKGVFYVFTGGNGGRGHRLDRDGNPVRGNYRDVRGGDNSNLNELANFYAVTAVCAVNDLGARAVYSEKGANLWVCAPSGDDTEDMGTADTNDDIEHRGVVTTENSNRYRDDFDGTSAAAPAVSGVAALLRQANSGLTWRDLKLILAGSARKNDPGNAGWAEGARKYEADSDGDRYHFNHEYGFGMVDAKAAVDLAKEWVNVPDMASAGATSQASVTIPAPSGGVPQTVTTTLTLDTDIRFTEFVEINTNFDHTSFRDMDIELVSPSGAVSKLAVPFNTRHYTTTCKRPNGSLYDCTYYVRLDGEFRFGSAKHLGEDPNGRWTLRLTDHFPAPDGTLRSWSLKVYGHVSRPGPLAITSPITSGAGSLTITWNAPSDDGGAAITAYDLRYIETSADETVDANWTLQERVWTTGSGPLQYTITGLTGGVQYDVQVRAVSSAGAGAWSAVANGIPAALEGAPSIYLARSDASPVRFGSPVPATATFSEPVSGFALEDIVVANGAAGNFSGSGAVYSFDVTPAQVGEVTVDIGANVAEDAESNGNTAAIRLSLGIPYDDDGDGSIGYPEAVNAVLDFLFGDGTTTRDQAVGLVLLYLFP